MRKQKPSKKNQDQKKSRQRYRMLNVYHLPHFKYDLNEVLVRSDMDPSRYDQFTANLITKATRRGINEAKDYVIDVCREGIIDESSADRIKRLLSRYSKLR